MMYALVSSVLGALAVGVLLSAWVFGSVVFGLTRSLPEAARRAWRSIASAGPSLGTSSAVRGVDGQTFDVVGDHPTVGEVEKLHEETSAMLAEMRKIADGIKRATPDMEMVQLIQGRAVDPKYEDYADALEFVPTRVLSSILCHRLGSCVILHTIPTNSRGHRPMAAVALSPKIAEQMIRYGSILTFGVDPENPFYPPK